MERSRGKRRRTLPVLMFFLSMLVSCSAWEWTDFLGRGDITFQTKTLTMSQVSDMRVRAIKRRLARTHGYSADELGRMIDKKDLIQALSFEEHKDREKEQQKLKRALLTRSIVVALIAVLLVLGWPLWQQIFEVGSVNFVVYTDRKKYEASRCLELKSVEGMFGILLMATVDILSFWLSATVLLSWFTTSKYFFPIPSLSFRPAQFMGDQVAGGPLSKYGVNLGPMALSWGFRFLNGRLEAFTGQAMSRAYRKQKKNLRKDETPEERMTRKAARRAAKKAAKEETERKRQEQESAETQRRKEAADKATEQLFSESGKTNNNNMKESRKEFQEQMEAFDMEDLD